MTPLIPDPVRILAAARRLVRRDALLATAATVAALVPLVLLVGWLVGGAVPWSAPSAWPLVLEGAAVLAGVALTLLLRRRWLAETGEAGVAASTEAARGLPEGSVRGVLELGRSRPVGTSDALVRRAQARLAGQLAGARADELTGEVGVRARSRRRGALVALALLVATVAAAGLAAPDRARAGWAPLVQPIRNLSAPPLPALVVSPGDATVDRGADLEVAVRAVGRREVTLWWHATGDIRRGAPVALRAEAGTGVIPRIDATTKYWVSARDGAVSDTFLAVPREALLVSDLVIDLEYPAYLGRQTERLTGEVGALEVPEGTTLRIVGRATRPLASVELAREDGAGTVRLPVQEAGFSGRWVPQRSGLYGWRLVGADGAPAAAAPTPLGLTVVEDVAPAVTVTFPAVDTVLGPELRQPVAGAAADDHGIRAASLVSWRVSAAGEREPPREEALALEGDPERVLLQGMVDAAERGMGPGDTLFYFLRVVDNAPAGQPGVSPTYRLWLPGMGEMRRAVTEDSRALLERAERAAESARELQETTEGLERRAARSARSAATGQRGGTRLSEERSLDFAGAEDARQVLERQESLLDQAEAMRRASEDLMRSMENAGLADPELKQRLEELSELYRELATPEMQDKLDQLREALSELDAEKMQEALRRVAEQQEELRERLEQSLELMRRAAAEQQMNAAAEDARELATRQEALSDAMQEEASPEARAQQQRDMEAQAEQLEEALKELRERLAEQDEEQAAERTESARSQTSEARRQMDRAASSAEQRQGEQAAAQGKDAAETLREVADDLESARERMAREWRQETEEAVEQAANEALSLADRQNSLVDEMRDAAERGEQPSGPRTPQAPQPPQAQAQAGEKQQAEGQQGQPMPQPPSAGGQQTQGGQQGAQGQQGGQGREGEQGSQQGKQGQGGDRSQQGGQQGGGQQGQQPGGQQQAAGQQQSGQGGGGGSSMSQLRAEQSALKQGLEQLGRNLSEAGQRSAMVNREVGAALGRAMLSMERTLQAMEGQQGGQRYPVPEAQQALDALNRLALSLLGNQQEIQNAQSGTGMEQALQQLSQLAKQQGSVNSQASSLMPMQLSPNAMSENLQRLSQQQQQIAQELGQLHRDTGESEGMLGRLDELACESEALAGELAGGRLSRETLARQERLFHRMLDAGRTLEQDELSRERVAERPGQTETFRAQALDPARIGDGVRFPVPDPERLRSLSPAYRRLILEYFERLNREGAGPGDDTR